MIDIENEMYDPILFMKILDRIPNGWREGQNCPYVIRMNREEYISHLNKLEPLSTRMYRTVPKLEYAFYVCFTDKMEYTQFLLETS